MRCHTIINIKPSSQLKLFECKQISIVSFTKKAVHVASGTAQSVYSVKINFMPSCNIVVSSADLVGNVSWILFQEGRRSELRLRQGVEQAAHTLNNPQVQCTGVLLCVITE